MLAFKMLDFEGSTENGWGGGGVGEENFILSEADSWEKNTIFYFKKSDDCTNINVWFRFLYSKK
jgi:hypothetical protein